MDGDAPLDEPMPQVVDHDQADVVGGNADGNEAGEAARVARNRATEAQIDIARKAHEEEKLGAVKISKKYAALGLSVDTIKGVIKRLGKQGPPKRMGRPPSI